MGKIMIVRWGSGTTVGVIGRGAGRGESRQWWLLGVINERGFIVRSGDVAMCGHKSVEQGPTGRGIEHLRRGEKILVIITS